jgi:hypothetical protein
MVKVPYGVAAIPHSRVPGKWLGVFHGDGVGLTRYVRTRDGAAQVFDTEEDAERAATDALIRSLNASRAPVAGKPIPVRRSRNGGKFALVFG